MQTFQARRATRSGALVVVADPTTARDLVGELVDLLAPDGSTAHGRVASVGRSYVDATGSERAYAYIDPATVVTDAA